MKLKKYLGIVCCLFLTTACLFGRNNDEYPSKDEGAYYKNTTHKAFEAIDEQIILDYSSKFFEIVKNVDFEPYTKAKHETPYLDSILTLMSYDAYVEKVMNHELDNDNIGKIGKDQILKYEKKDSISIFIYENYEYEPHFYGGGAGIWIAYSQNNEKDWNYYYTGIVQRQPIFLKWNSKRPLISDNGSVQIDACLTKQITRQSIPGGALYQSVKDSLLVVFNLNIIAKDSDGDGLTDIVEEKFHTDPNQKDTDGDGIPDNLDLNPRKNLPRTELSKVYEAIIDRDYGTIDEKGNIVFSEKIAYVTDSTKTVLVVTNDKDLMGVRPIKTRVIFVTQEEYDKYNNQYRTDLEKIDISPLFKVDNQKDTYKIRVSYNFHGGTYLIKKNERGWMVESISMWIS
jgi:hypothetical protein